MIALLIFVLCGVTETAHNHYITTSAIAEKYRVDAQQKRKVFYEFKRPLESGSPYM